MSKKSTENIKLAFFLSVIFTVIEIIGGVFTNSAAIISNGVHDLGDSFSLGFSWFLEGKAQKDSDHKYAYGYKRYSILGAFVSFISILFGTVVVFYESVPRLFHPEEVHVEGMVWLAIIGLIVNGLAYLRVRQGTTLNEHTTSLQIKEDVLSWAGILIIAILVYFNPQFEILDPILSLILIMHSLFHISKSLKVGFRVLLQGKPFDLNEQNLKDEILELKEVVEVYDLKTWTLDGEYNIITMKVILKSMTLEESEKSKKKIRLILDNFNLHHSTIELEFKKQNYEKF